MTIEDINGIFTGSASLSAKQQQELDKLNDEHARALKIERLNIFKRLPTHIRQAVVDDILWERAVEEMQDATIEKSQQHIELEDQERQSSYTIRGSNKSAYLDKIMNRTLKAGKKYSMNNWFTDDEIIEAHNDATAEETLLGDNNGM